MDDEAEAARQLVDLTRLPLARIIRLVNRSELWRVRFLLVTYSAATIRAWSESPGPSEGAAPVRQQEHLSDFADSLMEDDPCSGSLPSS
jgi:hypothetical protein